MVYFTKDIYNLIYLVSHTWKRTGSMTELKQWITDGLSEKCSPSLVHLLIIKGFC